MTTNGLNPRTTERRLDLWLKRYVKCATCVHGERLLFPPTMECSNPEGESGPFITFTDANCECHTFRNPALEARAQKLADDWHHSIDWDAVAAECDREINEVAA